MSASPLRDQRRSHTPGRHPLLPLPVFHSTPIAVPRRLSSDPTSAHLSFNQSWGSLPPVDLGGGKPCPIPSICAPIQAGISSVPVPITLPSESISALKLSADHTKEIFNLACEGCHLKEQITREFAKLSSQEVLFHAQVQSTGYEMLASGHSDRFTAYYMILQSDEETTEARDKAIEELRNWVGDARDCAQTRCCSDTCSIMRQNWTWVFGQSGGLDKGAGGVHLDDDASNNRGHVGAPLCAGLTILFCLLDTLPSFPANLTYQSTPPMITGFAPEVYAQQPWLGLHSLDLTHTPAT